MRSAPSAIIGRLDARDDPPRAEQLHRPHDVHDPIGGGRVNVTHARQIDDRIAGPRTRDTREEVRHHIGPSSIVDGAHDRDGEHVIPDLNDRRRQRADELILTTCELRLLTYLLLEPRIERRILD